MNSPLCKLMPNAKIDAEKVKRDGWHDHRILVIQIDDPEIDWAEKEMLIRIGNRKFGKGKNATQRDGVQPGAVLDKVAGHKKIPWVTRTAEHPRGSDGDEQEPG